MKTVTLSFSQWQIVLSALANEKAVLEDEEDQGSLYRRASFSYPELTIEDALAEIASTKNKIIEEWDAAVAFQTETRR